MEYYWTLFNNGCSTTCNAVSTTTAPSSTLNGSCSNTSYINPWHFSSWDLSFNGAATPDPVYNCNDATSDQHLTCLKLGKRHCFEAAETESNKRGKTYYSDGVDPPSTVAPMCQVEGCCAVLVNAKDYHRRHKVCETHAKSPKVTVNGVEQRFCQQCSRFHSVGEFDDNKRSCRRRLAGHNERRRKSSQDLRRPTQPGPAGRHLDPHNPGCDSRALSLLSSTSYNPFSDLPARCSAALRELIAENRANHYSPRPSWNSQFMTLDLMQARNSEFGLLSVNNGGGKQSDEGEEGGCSALWNLM